ncbi:MAG: 1-deoxy-D-xylulose-5-phosphate reductoisomerase [Rhodoferax sp.]
MSRDGARTRLVVLGSTGSIGCNTLDVVERHPARYEVFALTASTRADLMLQQCLRHRPRFAVMVDPVQAKVLEQGLRQQGLPTQVLAGSAALVDVAGHEEVDVVMAAIVGAAGLPACWAAAGAGKRLLLANKEALVVGADLFMQAVREGGCTLLPIDSEHSAVFQSLPQDPATWSDCVDKIILTASGGPFRTWDPRQLAQVTPEQACTHPNWVMGRKITVDSATMMNKALEVIEARYLFGLPARRIEVVIHPQSIIHSMVQFVDHSIVAQLGTTDMRVPIAYGLSWPQRIASGASALDFSSIAAMTFESVHTELARRRFPGLALAWHSLEAPSGTTAVLNAANEVAVEAFLERRIRFDQIHQVNEQTLARVLPPAVSCLDDLLQLDGQARAQASQQVLALRH